MIRSVGESWRAVRQMNTFSASVATSETSPRARSIPAASSVSSRVASP